MTDRPILMPYVKLDGPELWEIVFGIANEVAHKISDEQYTKIAEAINSVFIDVKPSPRAQALEEAAKLIDDRVSEYVQEHGVTDPETGTVEFPGWGDEYVSELEELAEGIRALSSQPVADRCPACGGTGRMGPYFPGGLSTRCANCSPIPHKDNAK